MSGFGFSDNPNCHVGDHDWFFGKCHCGAERPCEQCGGSGVIVIDHNGPGTDGTLPYEKFPCNMCSEENDEH